MNISKRRNLLALGIALAIAVPLQAGSYRWTTSGPEPGFIFQIVVNPQDSASLHLTAGSYGSLLFDTRDRGQSWKQNDFLSFANELIQDPSNGNVLYTLSSTAGVFGLLKTLDGGQTWFPAQCGSPQLCDGCDCGVGSEHALCRRVLRHAGRPEPGFSERRWRGELGPRRERVCRELRRQGRRRSVRAGRCLRPPERRRRQECRRGIDVGTDRLGAVRIPPPVRPVRSRNGLPGNLGLGRLQDRRWGSNLESPPTRGWRTMRSTTSRSTRRTRRSCLLRPAGPRRRTPASSSRRTAVRAGRP